LRCIVPTALYCVACYTSHSQLVTVMGWASIDHSGWACEVYPACLPCLPLTAPSWGWMDGWIYLVVTHLVSSVCWLCAHNWTAGTHMFRVVWWVGRHAGIISTYIHAYMHAYMHAYLACLSAQRGKQERKREERKQALRGR
jgi:hypothetical protein